MGSPDVIERRGVPASVTGSGSLFRIHMKPEAPSNYREAYPTADEAERSRTFFDALLDAGIALIYSCTGAVSTPMGVSEIECLIEIADDAFRTA